MTNQREPKQILTWTSAERRQRERLKRSWIEGIEENIRMIKNNENVVSEDVEERF